jgi:prepilin-type N-terminal cleavage/methylation domain-containing protein
MNDKTKNTFRFARGLTLIELMVASAIIVILILSVGTVLSGLGHMVGISQSAIRVNAEAASIGTVLCQDIRRAGQNGFICIAQASDGTPQLFILDPVSTPSITGGVTGGGGLSCLGECDNTGYGSILWHTTWVFNPLPINPLQTDSNLVDSISSGPQITLASGAKVYLTDMGRYQCLARGDCSGVVDGFQGGKSTVTGPYGLPYTLPITGTPGNGSATVPISLPPNTLGDLNNMWKILSLYASGLTIQWTDGTTGLDTTDNTVKLLWFGWTPAYNGGTSIYSVGTKVSSGGKLYQCITANGPGIKNGAGAQAPSGTISSTNYWSYQGIYPGPKDSNWAAYGPKDGKMEFGVNGAYRAVFCHEDSASCWPTAIKVRFTLIDPDAPKGSSFGNGLDYEIICPLSE